MEVLATDGYTGMTKTVIMLMDMVELFPMVHMEVILKFITVAGNEASKIKYLKIDSDINKPICHFSLYIVKLLILKIRGSP